MLAASPDVNKALLAAAWGFTAGISGCLLFRQSGFLFAFDIGWFLLSVSGAIVNAMSINGGALEHGRVHKHQSERAITNG